MAPNAEDGRRLVLIAYDGSDHAKAAIDEAGRVLGAGRPAVVLTVREPIESYGTGFGGVGILDPATVSAMQDSSQNEAQAVAEDGVALAKAAGFDAEPRVALGHSPWQEIVDAADDLDADVIAIGSRGRTGLTKMLLGSVASAVVQHSSRSVLILHSHPIDAPADV